ITTFYKDVHIKSGTNRLYLGTANRLSLIADPSHSYLRNAGTSSHFQIHSDNFSIRSHQGNGSITLFYSPITDGNEGGGPRLYHNHGAGIILERLRTTKSGVNITGVTTTTGLAVTGVSTFTGAIDANGDLDVDGHTNLDNVSIAGVTTISYSGTATYGLDVHNPTSGGSGARVRAGDNDSQYALLVENGSGTNLFEVLAGGGGARLRSGDLTILDKIGHYGDGNTFMRFPGPDQISFETAGDERFKIKSDGKVLITNTLGLGGATSNPGDLLHAQSTSGEGKIVLMGATTGTVAISGLNGTSRVLFGDSSTENAGNITYTHSDDSLSFR
ncbi:MAG: hypothetical protein VXY93_12660, partial [Pseudomonadota bacterium]|nr:hypothetical protein [Pseudomonadota bacterium]